ncbi:hypothetical protein CKM354_000891600 [Cercospora kikuchii]|uniref:Core-binding (CB) domain-containing protein n=1 Tax=Cercospora kikuchii TaxID=84275 RepID=A0A9P3CWQ8_9PEZI|nr:uncharacterized protein CKM354_000891600 [Cercospora kikuchii]GIZ45763.1 hypothetical protein CKM354_000891600 [Cercospora kikuchii]
MHLDIDKPIGEGFDSPEDLRAAIAEISKHTESRGEQLDWANHLKFLTADLSAEESAEESSSDSTGDDSEDADKDNAEQSEAGSVAPSEDDEDDCSCNDANVRQFSHNDRQLHLTTTSETPDCCHYIAVSYCWTSTGQAPYTGQPFTLQTSNNPPRPPSCTFSLLDRVIQFASWKQVSLIWIDQECIDQSDPQDKNVGIQSMDFVYQQASYCLAVLEATITEQRHLTALSELLENNVEMDDLEMIQDVCEALRIVMSDQWFERAWCLQESVSGNRQMTLSVRCSEDLEVPDLLGSAVTGCFEMELSELHHTIVSSLGLHLDQVSESLDPATLERYRQVINDWYENMAPDVSDDFDIEARTVCNASQALNYLSRRQNSVVADRLAILANLCRYEIRLNIQAVDVLGFGFSICAYILAIMNGDFSIDAAFCDWKVTAKTGRQEYLVSAPPHVQSAVQSLKPYSWFIEGDATMDKLPYFDHNANPLRIAVLPGPLTSSLQIRGCIWLANHSLDLSKLVSAFETQYGPEILSALQSPTWEDPVSTTWEPKYFSLEDARAQFLISLLCHLYKHKYSALHNHIWTSHKRRSTTSQLQNPEIASWAAAPFEEIVDIETETIKLPHPFPSFKTIKPRYQAKHPFVSLNTRVAKHLIQTILSISSLVIARPRNPSPDAKDSYTAFFDEHVKLGDTIFTPRSNGTLGVVPGYSWYPHVWLLDEMLPVAGDEGSVSATSRGFVSGSWHGKEEFEETLLLK